uniref:BY PROTMAP: gi/342319797/gb/EGU11743.1/ Proteophosphoglycan ppg4 [Rhodotorula glutinis ATCC 204091] n=1 Tax=Rhodotorula toruloides TaxID=5286 RepID=A0A0K3CD07_RHOTO
MPPPTQTWFSLIKEELPTLDAFLRKFVELYAPLKDKHGYQFFYSAGERKEMFELLDACIEDAKHPLKPSMKIHAPPPLTAAYQPYPFKLEPNYAYGPDTSVPDGVDEPHLNEAQTEALKEKKVDGLAGGPQERACLACCIRPTASLEARTRRTGYSSSAQAGSALDHPPFRTPNIAKCAQLVHDGKSHESEYMPNGWEQHAHASSGANSLAHPLLHNYSHLIHSPPCSSLLHRPIGASRSSGKSELESRNRQGSSSRLLRLSSPSRFSRMPHAWLHLVEYVQPSLNELLDHFVCLYTALENKDGYQSWFADWWKWWTKQGLGNTADVAPYNARWYFSHVERTRMLELLGAFIEDAQRADNDKHKIRSVQDLSSKFHKKKMRMSRGNVPEETHKPGRAATQAPFKTPNIAECARLVHEGKPLEPEYMPDEPVHHPHASSSANSLAHTLLHQYSHRQRAIYGL